MNAFIRTRTALALCVLLTSAAAACGGSNDSGPSPVNVPYSQTDLRVGTGAEAVPGRELTVHYTGWLYDPNAPGNKGRQFDSSAGREPFQFVLGAGRVIRGWDQGVAGMRVGGQRRLVIPPSLGYGAQGFGSVIPPNATLLFEIELLNVS
jgi:FKBP-type peptidyl-prolyl cis-trans isomerase FkpA